MSVSTRQPRASARCRPGRSIRSRATGASRLWHMPVPLKARLSFNNLAVSCQKAGTIYTICRHNVLSRSETPRYVPAALAVGPVSVGHAEFLVDTGNPGISIQVVLLFTPLCWCCVSCGMS